MQAVDGPRRYGATEMKAVEVPAVPAVPAAAAELAKDEADEVDFDFDINADGALDSASPVHDPSLSFDMPSVPKLGAPLTGRVTPGPMARVTPAPMPSVASPSRTVSGEVMLPPAPPWSTAPVAACAVDPHAALVAFAGFGAAPSSLWQAPAYALRVVMRKRSLRADLELARGRRSHDVGIYEASLRSADDSAVRNGLIVMATSAVIGVLLVVALVRVLAALLSFTG